MKPELSEVIHLYLGCEVQVTYYENGESFIDTIEALIPGESINLKKAGDYYFDDENDFQIKLILHCLEDMTEEHQNKCLEFGYIIGSVRKSVVLESKRILFLIKNHYDLFNLIPSDFAVDAKTLKK